MLSGLGRGLEEVFSKKGVLKSFSKNVFPRKAEAFFGNITDGSHRQKLKKNLHVFPR